MTIITEEQFRAALIAKLEPLRGIIKGVIGPGRSGAIASVYASHYLRAAWLPATMGLLPSILRPLLVIDTAAMSGASLRKIAKRFEAEHSMAIFDEPPRVKFWYEEFD